MKKQLRKGKIENLWDYLAKLHQHQPEAFESAGYLRAMVARNWEALNKKEECPNCDASMIESVPRLDFHNAVLLKRMGDEVKQKLRQGVEFKEANAVHVVSLNTSDAIRHRTTMCRTLGLIAKVRNEKGGHDTKRGWLITKRGWDALRGEAVPAEVVVFRNKIEERSDEMITLREVFASRTAPEDEELIGRYEPQQYYQMGKAHQGKML